MAVTRRHVMIGSAAMMAGSVLPAPAIAQARPKVVVVGGGAGGASVVQKLSAAGGFEITLVEPQHVYTSCFYSNLYLGGFQSLSVLQHDYKKIDTLPGVALARDRAREIDRTKRRVILAGGTSLAYDRLVLSPGISLDYGSVPGWSAAAETRMPHAWQAGAQTEILKRQLDAVPDGGLIVVIAPPDPYRCPPGPYERVSMMAHALQSSGRSKARIVIIDAKTKFSKQPLFQQGWERHYPGMIEWMPPTIHAGIKRVDPESMTVETGFETYNGAALVNVIPAQRAGTIALEAGLGSANGYCDVDPFSMKSRLDQGVFVLGDAAMAGDMPKSAFSANSQAGAVVQAIVQELHGKAGRAVAYANKCWSLIATDDSVFVSGRYRPTATKIEQVASDVSTLKDTAVQRRTNYVDSAGWYVGLTSEMFTSG